MEVDEKPVKKFDIDEQPNEDPSKESFWDKMERAKCHSQNKNIK